MVGCFRSNGIVPFTHAIQLIELNAFRSSTKNVQRVSILFFLFLSTSFPVRENVSGPRNSALSFRRFDLFGNQRLNGAIHKTSNRLFFIFKTFSLGKLRH